MTMIKKYAASILCSALSLALLLTVSSSCRTGNKKDADPFIKEENAWRAERDVWMKAPTSWLTIAGLFWLEEGDNAFGTAEGNAVRLPEGSALPAAGKFVFSNGRAEVIAADGAVLTSAGKKVTRMDLKDDTTGKPDILALNELRMWIIRRGNRYAVRLRDLNALPYKNYKGLDFFPPDPAFRIKAEFDPYAEPKKVTVPTAVGTEAEMDARGIVKFRIHGENCELEAFDGGKAKLFFIFRDGTSGEETYGASRFMSADILPDGTVDMNFNRAYNPPCAYTAYATCPLPPSKNVLRIRIEAGEKAYPGSAHH